MNYEPGYDSQGKLLEVSIVRRPPAPEVCKNCGRPAFKSGSSGLECYNLANYGDCEKVGAPGSKPRSVTPLPGRNELCPCGSGRKYKRCHSGKPLSFTPIKITTA